jgi:hypothetical protein
MRQRKAPLHGGARIKGPTGSEPNTSTIGIVEVAAFAARAEVGPPTATIEGYLADDQIGHKF